MRKFGISIISLTFAIVATAPAFAGTYVAPYVKRDGTYVQGHYRSSPDNTFRNNYDYKGNYNPYTGEPGDKTYDCYPFCP